MQAVTPGPAMEKDMLPDELEKPPLQTDGKPNPTDPAKPEEKTISYWALYTGVDSLDIVLMVVGSIGAGVNGAAWPVFAIIFSSFTDTFGDPGNPSFSKDVAQIALYFLYLALGAMAGAFVQATAWMYVGNRQTSRLRLKYLAAVLKQDIGYFDVHTTTGSLLQGLNDDSNAVQQAISEKVAHFIQHSSTFIVGWSVALWRGWDMTLVMVGCLPFLALVGIMLSKLTSTMSKLSQEAYTKASSIAQQAMSQIRTVAAYGQEAQAVKEYTVSLDTPYQVGVRQAIVTGASLGSINAIAYLTYAIAFYYGAWRVSTGDYTGGDVMNVLVAALLGGFSLGQASPVLQQFAMGRAAGTRLFAVINRKPLIDSDAPGIEPTEQVVGELELRDVTFSYPARPDMVIFSHFNLSVPAGQTVALVGSSGSGKSTVVGLLERYYDPYQGLVLLDGVDIRTLKLPWLRRQMGLVSQEPTLFATTIFENIAMGRPGATRKEVQEAALAANAATFIGNLPEGLDTHVGERGLALSGGQKQRIAIARAILKNPRIMLLDEATSALDTESERIVQEALNRLVVGRTTVVVAHRLSTIRDADTIAVVQKGVIVEQGSHDELVQNPIGAYTVLVKLQMQQEATQATQGIDEGVEENDDREYEEEGVPEEPMPFNGNGNGSAFAHRSVQDRSAVPPMDIESGGGYALGGPTGSGGIALGGPAGSGFNASRVSSGHVGRVSSDGNAGGPRRRSGSVNRRTSLTKDSIGLKVDNKKEDTGKVVVAKPVSVPMSRLLAYNRPEWGYGVVGTIASGANGCVQPAFAFVMSSMIVLFYQSDRAKVKNDAGFWSGMFVVIAFGCFTATALQQFCFGVIGNKLALRVRVQLFTNIMRQEIGWFDLDENSSGVLTTRLATDATHIRGAVGDALSLMIQNCMCLFFGYLIAFAYEWRMALLVTGILPFMVAGMIIYYSTITGFESGSDKLYAVANQAVSDAFTSIRVVQAYNLEDQVCKLYGSLVTGANSTMVKRSVITGSLMGYSQLTTFGIYSLIIWFGGLEVSSGRASFDDMLKAFLAILLAAIGLAQAQIGFPDIGKAKTAVQHIFPLLDRVPLIDASSPNGLMPDVGVPRLKGKGDDDADDAPKTGAIELRDITFSYPSRPSVVVFKNFNLSIPAGKTAALVGESGSGKSTIVGLVERFYDPAQGTVFLDGVDIRTLKLSWLRSQISLVSQEPLLFSTTILENIRYGRPDATYDECIQAAIAANVHHLVDALPQKYDTQVGEKGIQLSGGQKQRVAIARAVVKNPRIMLLDEATSALDAQSEATVQEALDRIMIGRTSVVVAHRLSTIRHADVIALVYRGSILEQGSHEELVSIPGGGYARLVAAQMGSKALANNAYASSHAGPSTSVSRSSSKGSLATAVAAPAAIDIQP